MIVATSKRTEQLNHEVGFYWFKLSFISIIYFISEES